MKYLLAVTEGTIIFFFLCLTIIKTYSFKIKVAHKYIITLLLAIAFFVCNTITNFTNHTYLFFIILLLVFSTFYVFIVFSKPYINIMILLLTYLFLSTVLKSFVTFIFGIQPLNQGSTNTFPLFYYPLFYLILFTLSLFFQKRPLQASLKLPAKYWGIMILIPSVVGIISQAYYFNDQMFSLPNLYALAFLGLVLVTIMMSYYLSYIITATYDSLFESRSVNQRLKLQLDHIDRSMTMIEQIRRDKHEMKNVYFYIQSMIKSKKYTELEEFVDTKLINRYDRIEEFNTGNYILDCLLTQKINEARDASIQLYADVIVPSHLPINDNDLCGLLLNLLDNAIDASKKEANGDIHLTIKVVKSYLSIQVKNKSSFDVLKQNPQLLTSKKDAENHGIGLQIIQSITDKYNGIKRIYMKSGYFCIDIMLELQQTNY